MHFELSEKTKDLQQRLTAFMEEHIYPNEQRFNDEIQRERWSPTRIIEELKLKARDAGLWNLFLPHDERGAGLTNLEYAPLCEIMGRSVMAPEAAERPSSHPTRRGAIGLGTTSSRSSFPTETNIESACSMAAWSRPT